MVSVARFSQAASIFAVPLLPSQLIFDERFPAGVALAQQFHQHGVPIHAITGDVTTLWYHDLYFRWQNDPQPIAGITTAASLFCLEILARDAGLRVTDRREQADGLVSWTIGPRPARLAKGRVHG